MEKKNNGLIVLIVALAVVALGLCGFIVYDKVLKSDEVKQNTPVETKPVQVEQKLTVEDLVNAINNNPNLLQEEKDLILSSQQIFVDNIEYFDEDIVDVLSKIKTNYTMDRYTFINVNGTYDPTTYELTFYDCEDFAHVGTSTFTHEFCHSLQDTERMSDSWSVEGNNSIVNSEYYGLDSSLYVTETNGIYAIYEILGGDFLRTCNFSKGDKALKEALYQIIPDQDLIDKLWGYETALHDDMFNRTFSFDNIKYYENEIKNILGMFYEAKYGRSMSDDLKMLKLLDFKAFAAKIKELYNIEMDDEVLYYALKVHDNNYIFNTDKMNEDYYMTITVPVEAKMERYDYLTLEQAAEEGVIEMHEDGTYTVLPSPYYQDENGMFYRQDLVVSDEVNVYTIDESNRYLDNGLSR